MFTEGIKMDEAALSNLLVAQKDKIIRMINDKMYSEAQAALNVVSELWALCDYRYKHTELENRIMDAFRRPE